MATTTEYRDALERWLWLRTEEAFDRHGWDRSDGVVTTAEQVQAARAELDRIWSELTPAERQEADDYHRRFGPTMPAEHRISPVYPTHAPDWDNELLGADGREPRRSSIAADQLREDEELISWR